jgi:hypothetical protein
MVIHKDGLEETSPVRGNHPHGEISKDRVIKADSDGVIKPRTDFRIRGMVRGEIVTRMEIIKIKAECAITDSKEIVPVETSPDRENQPHGEISRDSVIKVDKVRKAEGVVKVGVEKNKEFKNQQSSSG